MDTPPASCLERILEFDAIHNFRDIGGIPTRLGPKVRRGVIFRSGDLSDATDADLCQLDALGIRTIIDLRTPDSQEKHPDRLPQGRRIRVLRLPFTNEETRRVYQQLKLVEDGLRDDIDGSRLLRDVYESFPRDFGREVRTVLLTAAQGENLPLVVHCTLGKDRTGFLVAVLLSVLGVAYEDILQDYLLSNWCTSDLARRYLSQLPFPETVRTFVEAHEEFLNAAFEAMEAEQGSLTAYLTKNLGVNGELIDQLRHTLLEVDKAMTDAMTSLRFQPESPNG